MQFAHIRFFDFDFNNNKGADFVRFAFVWALTAAFLVSGCEYRRFFDGEDADTSPSTDSDSNLEPAIIGREDTSRRKNTETDPAQDTDLCDTMCEDDSETPAATDDIQSADTSSEDASLDSEKVPFVVNCDEGFSFADDHLSSLLGPYDLETITSFSSTGGYDLLIFDLGGIECLTTLTALELYDHPFESIEPLAELTHLKTLALTAPFDDLSPLRALRALTAVALTGYFDTIDALADLKGVENLSLHGPFSNIEALSQMRALKVLDMSENGNLSDLSPIRGATALTFLNVRGNRIEALWPLAAMSALNELHLSENIISDIGPLGAVSSLQRLFLSKNSIADLAPIASHRGLEQLDVSMNQVSDLTPLNGLSELTDLNATDNFIVDTKPFATLTALSKLDLSNNFITDVEGLSSLTELTHLNLTSNSIRSVQALASLTQVSTLGLADNPLADLTGLSKMTGLSVLYLNDCGLGDLAPLLENPGLGPGDRVFVSDNPLLCRTETGLSQLRGLAAKGVRVESDCGTFVSEDTDSGHDTDSEADTDTAPVPDPWPIAEPLSLSNVTYRLDPYNRAPLSAVVVVRDDRVSPSAVVRAEITVVAPHENAEDLAAEVFPQTAAYKANFDTSSLLESDEVGIPVLGLYPSTDNAVRFRITDGARIFEGEVTIPVTEEISAAADSVTVLKADTNRMAPGFTYLNGRMYDRFGNLRWVGPKIYRILRNGNYVSDLKELSFLGKLVRKWTLPDYLESHQHDTIELPGGNVAVPVSNSETVVENRNGLTVTSIQDYIVELDSDSNIVNAWDLRNYLDVDRATVISRATDWVHVNTLAYDAFDDSIIVSGRYQAIFKLSRGGQTGETADVGKSLVWIFAPHVGWGTAGFDGSGDLDTNLYLLSAVDAGGTRYPYAVQQNLAAPDAGDDFYWPVAQHGIHITARAPGKISFLTFNNQASVLFDGVDSINNGVTSNTEGDVTNDRAAYPYSQFAEYEVDENAMTVRQLWGFGQEMPELYGSRNCGVNLMKNGNRMMVTNGGNQQDPEGEGFNPHVVEIADLKDVVFHLEVTDTTMSAYRAGRVDPYHPAGAR